ncbi:autophagy-related protein 22-1 [Paraphoma chrysanthemicola]|nr:autophagy-related protein 22-1 [Paraphoma chrysanthemicola]
MSFDEDNQYIDYRQSNSHPHYDGEDTSPTTRRELSGWYAYPVAAEVFAVVAVGAFLPVILEQLARENGVFFSDRTKPCVGAPDAGRLRMSDVQSKTDTEQCMIEFLGTTISTSSFAMYTFSSAVLVQALTLVCFSSFADHGPYRKNMLMTFAYTGSVASALFIFITPRIYFLAPILVIVGVTSLGCSFVLLNAFLPVLVAKHADNVSIKPLSVDSASDVELEALNPGECGGNMVQSEAECLARDLERSARMSSKGVGYGYIAAVLVQIISIVVLWLFSKSAIQKQQPSLPIRVILLLVGVWWAVFSIPTLLWLRPRPGPPLPSQQQSSISSHSKVQTFLFYTTFSLGSFWQTLLKAMSLRQTLIFLISWFLLSDAVATISGTAVLFARTELNMGTIAIALLSITSIGSGIIGAFAWPHVQKYFSLEPKSVLLFCIAGMELIPLYGLLGFIPLFKNLGFIGLQKPWEIYPIAVVHGIVMGGISSYARSVYAPLIPEGSEVAFFALYAVTDKGSSAFGPAFVGWIVDHAGSIRPAFIFLAILVVLPAPLLWVLNVEKGREDAKSMAGGDSNGTVLYARVEDE